MLELPEVLPVAAADIDDLIREFSIQEFTREDFERERDDLVDRFAVLGIPAGDIDDACWEYMHMTQIADEWTALHEMEPLHEDNMTAHPTKPTITPARLAWFAEYYRKHPEWGAFHVSLADGNWTHGTSPSYSRGEPGEEDAIAWFNLLTPSQRRRLEQRSVCLAAETESLDAERYPPTHPLVVEAVTFCRAAAAAIDRSEDNLREAVEEVATALATSAPARALALDAVVNFITSVRSRYKDAYQRGADLLEREGGWYFPNGDAV